MFVSKKAAENKLGKSRSINRPIFTNWCRYAAGWNIFLSFLKGAHPGKSASIGKILKRSREARRMKKGEEKKEKGTRVKSAKGAESKDPPPTT